MTGIKDLNRDDLENLLIALLNVRTADNKHIALRPKEVFQDWFLKLIPGAVQ
jgi:hypothetical protein